MYVPKYFAETDPEKLFDFIQANSFGILFSQYDGHPYATHLPFLVEQAEPIGRLTGHVAKANPHWHAPEEEVLVVFPGPHVYISPAWYEEEKVVPTWNYVAVHVYGQITWIHDEEQLLKIVHDSVEFYESGRSAPWQFDPSSDYIHKMLRGIVGFKIEITRLEGKWKLNQNHSTSRQEKVVNALSHSTHQDGQIISRLMEGNLRERMSDK